MSTQAARAPSPQSPILLREMVGPIAVLTLNRPAARNSLSTAMIARLHAELDDIGNDKAIRGVVLAANGPAFSAGHDMKELTARRTDPDRGRAFFAEAMNACSAMMQAIVRLPKPVVAAVQGIATAAGCQLVASCDLAIASEAASFATPGVDIGLFCSTPMVALSRNVPRKQAMEMLLTGDMIDGREALKIGLVNRLAPSIQVMEETLALASEIIAKSPLTLKIGKEAFYRQTELGLAEAYTYASKVMAENMMALDAAEGIDAFLQKRKPEWKGC